MSGFKDCILLKITPYVLQKAEALTKEQRASCASNPKSHYGGYDINSNSILGACGQLAFEYWLIHNGIRYERGPRCNSPYDIVTSFGSFDCKTGRGNYTPHYSYGVIVRDVQLVNEVDNYAFCYYMPRAWPEYDRVYLTGWLPKSRFLQVSKPVPANYDVVYNGRVRWRTNEPCHLTSIGDLYIYQPDRFKVPAWNLQ